MHSTPRLISEKHTCLKTGLGRSTIRRKVAAQQFPAPVQVTSKRIAFIEAEIDEWITSRPRVGEGGRRERS
ncbi:hypothetical protein DC522_21740 [Microvirga sp. KLBC 81]|uniref:helix-turn-helix transcriptional regulator n=1 Tax=Microvirga sp. KLBC 81 TaxID=1862707 RepID=UPI000D513E3A|nr:AlpA family phage regulatory protein [Microvirga sp. KLBC 81]PVE22307.1 hypothetical protein DC522_21740 [Microvirga sp. KLBC 81]